MPELHGLAKAHWKLRGEGGADAWIEQSATPDGCVEILRRHRGRSRWGDDQPDTFVVGLTTRAQTFSITGDASFEALRLWPWAWDALGAIPLASLFDRWRPFPGADLAEIAVRLASYRELAAIGAAIIVSPSVGAMGAATGMPPRRLQRWFARHVGLPPREYLRLLRFQSAFSSLEEGGSLAEHAAGHGFADQSHLAREMRRLAGMPPAAARTQSFGPFLRR